MRPRLPELDDRLWFPDPSQARRGQLSGLLALGGDLSVPRLLLAYRSGIFPWTADPITWWSPDPRGIFEFDTFHIGRSLARALRKGVFEVTVNRAFREVMEGCARPDERGQWITPEFIAAYTRLHEAGHAHSVECWRQGELAGGIYGVAVGGLFAGESMFYRLNNASKVALCHLVQRLRDRGYRLFDIQMITPITAQLGATPIPRAEYLERLREAVALDCRLV
jgi:leucyl/phenylalanyl-tRNA--protein transferase